MSNITSKLFKYGVFGAANAFGFLIFAHLYSVHTLTKRDERPVRKLRRIAKGKIENIETFSEDGLTLSAWLVRPPTPNGKIVILLSGRGSNRNFNVERARFYIKRGYTVLMPDLRGTGRSSGKRITMGWHERKDLIAWNKYVRLMGFEYVAAHGFSLGAATISYTLKDIPDFEFIVIESCYSEFYKVVKDGISRIGRLPGMLAYSIMPITEYLADINSKLMRPIEYIKECPCPLLVLAGDSERLVSLEATIDLFTNNGAPFSKLHLFKGGKHENFPLFFRQEYKKVLYSFLDMVE